MVQAAERVEWIVAANEVEAFFLEFNLIKQHRPRFNIRLKDDKSYPYLAVTLDEEWPRAMVLRAQKRKGVRYFGPYAHAYAIRETLDLLLRTFPIRTCTKAKFDRHHRLGRPCLYAHIEKCAAPCVDAIDHEEYDKLVAELIDFLDGEHDAVLKRLEQRMNDAAAQLEFELAARIRDQLGSVRKAIERQADGREPRGGLRPARHRRGRPGSERAGLLRPQGPGRRPQGADRRQGRGRRAAGARRATRRAAVRGRAVGAEGDPRAGRARGPRALRGVPLAQPRFEGADPRAAARRQARAAVDRER